MLVLTLIAIVQRYWRKKRKKGGIEDPGQRLELEAAQADTGRGHVVLQDSMK